ncbi:ATP-dependent zinc protease [Pseudomonadota bacterium]
MSQNLITLGWREWVSLPDLELAWIKAKVDTGAKTSCLHAFSIKEFTVDDKKWIRFGIHPRQKDTETELLCEAEVIDERMVSDSGGHKEKRYVISTDIMLANQRWPIEITLTNRDNMRFRMLLGRTAMEHKIIVDPGESFLLGKPTTHL